MIELSKLHGTGVALATPFTSNLDVDFEGLEKLLSHVIHGGVDYVVVMGTTGESPTINADEKKKILDFIAEKIHGTLPIVYGMGGNDTAKLQNDLKNLDTTHIDAILSANPYYNKPQQNGIIHHYEQAADVSKVPLILYNVPARTASNLLSDTTLELAEHENIIGTKEASGDLVQCAKIAAHKPDDFLLISGEDMLTVPMISVGAKGVISVLANLAPKPFSEMVNAALEGDFEGANETYYELLSLNDLVVKEGNPIGLKYAMKVVGICQEYLRPPLMVASKDLQKEIDSWTS
jgi:4-hydroxy-tetrahydrodipicolinate synthase